MNVFPLICILLYVYKQKGKRKQDVESVENVDENKQLMLTKPDDFHRASNVTHHTPHYQFYRLTHCGSEDGALCAVV